MNPAYTTNAYSIAGIFYSLIVVSAAFVIAKILTKIGIATKKKSSTVAIVLAALVGIWRTVKRRAPQILE
ncbi:hypothetical protein D4S03_09265 [bacterium]|nr:MAG: hypothetical protein D4S03_09265 [bacterium]